MFQRFTHYLSYGATDQETLRHIRGQYDGLLVPGTIAAFQANGTKGFVLTLGVSKKVDYAIDPRFPLFQQALATPKKSHNDLAATLGDPKLVQPRDPTPAQFDDARIAGITDAWLRFNRGYTTLKDEHFKKYAARLGEPIELSNAHLPTYVLPPYLMASGPDDPWWDSSMRFWDAAEQANVGSNRQQLVRVVGAKNAGALDGLLSAVNDAEIAVWVSGLDELVAVPGSEQALIEYGRAIRKATNRGSNLFALYGGFFSVLLANCGLRGSSHGIGYGEARQWLELPSSGPAPARYYLPRAHRYVSQDLAGLLWTKARELIECGCPECGGKNPARLDYHALMKHSVHCRSEEINAWNQLPFQDAVARLEVDSAAFDEAIPEMEVPRALQRQADQCYVHLRKWANILRALDR